MLRVRGFFVWVATLIAVWPAGCVGDAGESIAVTTEASEAAPRPPPPVKDLARSFSFDLVEAEVPTLVVGLGQNCIQLVVEDPVGIIGGNVTAAWDVAPGSPRGLELGFYRFGEPLAKATRATGSSPLHIVIPPTRLVPEDQSTVIYVGAPGGGGVAVQNDVAVSVSLTVEGGLRFTPATCTLGG